MPAKQAAKLSGQLIGPPNIERADEIVAASSETKLSKTIAIEARSACAIMFGDLCRFGLFGVIFQSRRGQAESSRCSYLNHAAHDRDQRVMMNRVSDCVHEFTTNCRSNRRRRIEF